jgi:hypothetical protein
MGRDGGKRKMRREGWGTEERRGAQMQGHEGFIYADIDLGKRRGGALTLGFGFSATAAVSTAFFYWWNDAV